MNREIKFRAWDKSFNRYTKREFLISSCHKNTIEVVGVSLDENVDDLNEDIVLEQYTGLKDRNGVEIYEGDILKFPFGSIAYVINDGFQIGLKSPGSESVSYYEYKEMYEICKVIGNIHENPELI